jgi:membrane fusion protein (multidrug efflux system)
MTTSTKPPRRWALPALALSGVIAGALLATTRSEAADPPPQKPAQPPVPVKVVMLSPEPYATKVTATGEIRPRETVDISPEVARKLVKVHVEDGQRVEAGALLFELDRADIDAELARLRVESKYSRAALSRFEALASSGSVSQDDRDKSRLRLDDAQARLATLEVQLARTKITAPFSGTFGFRTVSVGAWVTPGQNLGRLTDLSTLLVDFRLPERYATDIANGTSVKFTVDASQTPYTAEVIAIDPAIDKTSRSVVVRAKIASLQGPVPGLLPGMFATVEVPLTSRETLFVPSIAVIPSPTGARVFIEEGGKAKAVEVTLGAREAARVEIAKGLAPGARVIVTNLLRVRAGAPVAVLPEGTP